MQALLSAAVCHVGFMDKQLVATLDCTFHAFVASCMLAATTGPWPKFFLPPVLMTMTFDKWIIKVA